MKLFKIRQIFSPLFLESVNTMATEGAENSGESAEPLMTEQTNRQNARILRVFATVIYSVFYFGSLLEVFCTRSAQLNAPPATNWNHSIAATSIRFPSPKN